jgi:hypothetical protein
VLISVPRVWHTNPCFQYLQGFHAEIPLSLDIHKRCEAQGFQGTKLRAAGVADIDRALSKGRKVSPKG